ncbi:MAG: Mth938-like domain-containing protein [Alphaproteobacteria bacterium]
MDITPWVAHDAKVIQRYGPGRFTVTGEHYSGPILVTPTEVRPWTDKPLAAWAEADLESLFAVKPPIEILLIGTGAQMAPIPAALRTALRARGVGCDGMDTGAACRTYNVLLAEARRVAAVLIAVA